MKLSFRPMLAIYMVLALALPTALLVLDKADGVAAVLLGLMALVAIYLLREMEAAEQARVVAEAAVAEQKKTTDGAYLERNYLVALLARLYPSGIRKTEIEGWDADWQGCVYIDLPAGQISYHYHITESSLFRDLPPYTKPWDGHDKLTVHGRLLNSKSLNGLVPAVWLDNWRAEYVNTADQSAEVRANEIEAIRMFCEKLENDLTEYLGMRAFLKRYPEPDWTQLAERHNNELLRRAVGSVSV
jgi:hypothetical protein